MIEVAARLIVGGTAYAVSATGVKIIATKALEEVTLTTAEKICVGAAKFVATGIVGGSAYQMLTGGNNLGTDLKTLYEEIKNKAKKEEDSKEGGDTPAANVEPAAA